MKRLINFIPLAFLIFVSSIPVRAQDPDIDRLQKITGIIEKVNALPVGFLLASPELLPAGLANVNKQAALLKQLPAGTVVEIGVHTYAIGDEPKNVILTQTRADKIRQLLVAGGIPAASLTALGYGSSKPLISNAQDPKNRRIEYRITSLGTSSSTTPASVQTPVKNVGSGTPAIVAGQGWGRVEIGATRSQVEFILGQPEFFGIDSSKPEESYATYFQKGVVVVYKTKGLAVTMLRFIGNAALYSGGKSKFSSFQGKPDKGLAWNSTGSQVVAAYGTPVKREAYEDYPNKVEIANLHYPGIHLVLKGDKLLQVNIESGGPVASTPQPVVTPNPQALISAKKQIDNAAGEELFYAVEKNQKDQVRDMIKRGMGLNFERDGETTLIVAIRNYRTEIARMLLEAGADPEFAESKYGASPIHWAVQMSDYDTLELLIGRYKVDVNQRTKSNNTPLHIASDFGQSWGLTKTLLAAGANANVINDKGESPLDIARAAKKFDIVTTLEKVTNSDEITKMKLAGASLSKAPEQVRPVAVVTPTPTPKPKKIYGPDEDDPDEVASLVSTLKTAARSAGFELYDEGTAIRQGRNSNSESGGIRKAVFKGTIYQFVIISKDALAINAVMNGTLLTVPCNSCRTSISTYSTSIEKSSSQNGYYLLSFQMQVENFQNNYVTFIPKGNTAGAPIKWLYYTKPAEKK